MEERDLTFFPPVGSCVERGTVVGTIGSSGLYRAPASPPHPAVQRPCSIVSASQEPLAAEEQAFTAYAYREPVMRALYDRAAAGLASLAREDGVRFLDARPIYSGVGEAVFTDDVHFRTTRGYEELARAIASALPDDALDRPQAGESRP
jgi:hypothetical protein